MTKEQEQPGELSEGALERYNQDTAGAIAIRSLDDISRISKIFIQSGMFKGDKDISQAQQVYQAGVKIIAGVEFGIQPFAAMRGINIINGNAEMSANLMAAKVKKHPKYDYRVKESTNDACTIEFFEVIDSKREYLGKSTWTMEDAKRAGLTRNPTWQKFPMNMCFARALSNGVRLFTPDVFYGAPVYVEGEIGGEFETTAPAAQDDSPKEEPADTPATSKDEPVEGEIVDDKPDEPVADDEDDQKVMSNVYVQLTELGIGDIRIKQFIRETTGKPFLRNCKHEDLVKLAERIDAIKKGDETLPDDWYETPVMEEAA